MAIRIQIPTPMRQHTDGKATVEAAGGTVKAALDDLGRQFPGITQRLFDNGQVRRFVNVYLNDEDIRYLENMATAVKDGDELGVQPLLLAVLHATVFLAGSDETLVQPDAGEEAVQYMAGYLGRLRGEALQRVQEDMDCLVRYARQQGWSKQLVRSLQSFLADYGVGELEQDKA